MEIRGDGGWGGACVLRLLSLKRTMVKPALKPKAREPLESGVDRTVKNKKTFHLPPTTKNSKLTIFHDFRDLRQQFRDFRFLEWHRVEKVGFRTKNHGISKQTVFQNVLGKLFRGSKFSEIFPKKYP